MNVAGRPTRTIWPSADGAAIEIIDQRQLPHVFATARLATLEDAAHAIRAMLVRGASLIGLKGTGYYKGPTMKRSSPACRHAALSTA